MLPWGYPNSSTSVPGSWGVDKSNIADISNVLVKGIVSMMLPFWELHRNQSIIPMRPNECTLLSLQMIIYCFPSLWTCLIKFKYLFYLVENPKLIQYYTRTNMHITKYISRKSKWSWYHAHNLLYRSIGFDYTLMVRRIDVWAIFTV